MVTLSSSTEDQASDWIMKLCQTVAGSSEFLYTTLCPAARAIPCCAAVTKEHVVTFHAHINGEYRYLSSFFIQDITQILVDNEVRNYCILVSNRNFFDHSVLVLHFLSFFGISSFSVLSFLYFTFLFAFSW